MYIPTANEMAKALTYLYARLGGLGLIDYNQSNGILEAASKLRNYGASKAWRYRIERSKPLILIPISSARLNVDLYPVVFADIEIDEALLKEKGFPFRALSLTLEIINKSNGQLIHRIHIDLATFNEEGKYQDGPIFHLQFGGKSSEKKTDPDVFKLRRPRLLHPPMDLILMAEMLITNFYPAQWEKLKNQPGWIALIADSQKLCYMPFFNIANEFIEKDSLMKTFWASNWDA